MAEVGGNVTHVVSFSDPAPGASDLRVDGDRTSGESPYRPGQSIWLEYTSTDNDTPVSLTTSSGEIFIRNDNVIKRKTDIITFNKEFQQNLTFAVAEGTTPEFSWVGAVHDKDGIRINATNLSVNIENGIVTIGNNRAVTGVFHITYEYRIWRIENITDEVQETTTSTPQLVEQIHEEVIIVNEYTAYAATTFMVEELISVDWNQCFAGLFAVPPPSLKVISGKLRPSKPCNCTAKIKYSYLGTPEDGTTVIVTATQAELAATTSFQLLAAQLKTTHIAEGDCREDCDSDFKDSDDATDEEKAENQTKKDECYKKCQDEEQGVDDGLPDSTFVDCCATKEGPMSGPPEWGVNPEGDILPIMIFDGCPPFYWSIDGGEGYTLSEGNTSEPTNLLIATPEACGDATIIVSDACGEHVLMKVVANRPCCNEDLVGVAPLEWGDQNADALCPSKNTAVYVKGGQPNYKVSINGGPETESQVPVFRIPEMEYDFQLTVTDACGSVISKIVEVQTVGEGEPFPETINPGESLPLPFPGGRPPFNWQVSGPGFSLAQESTINGNVLYADDTACGTASILITDACGITAEKGVRSTDGIWVFVENREFPNCPGGDGVYIGLGQYEAFIGGNRYVELVSGYTSGLRTEVATYELALETLDAYKDIMESVGTACLSSYDVLIWEISRFTNQEKNSKGAWMGWDITPAGGGRYTVHASTMTSTNVRVEEWRC